MKTEELRDYQLFCSRKGKSSMSQWVKFDKAGTNATKYAEFQDALAVIVYPSGEMAIMKAAYSAIGKPDKVCLYTNGGQAVAIGAAQKGDDDAYTVSHGGRDSEQQSRINAQRFVKATRLNSPGAINVWMGRIADGMLVIDTGKAPYSVIAYRPAPRQRRK